MDLFRLSSIYKNRSGQTAVEYILLLAVLMSIGYAIFQSDTFKNFIGGDSTFFAALTKYTEYTYRHATGIGYQSDSTDASNNHKSYYTSGQSRFFVATGDPYP